MDFQNTGQGGPLRGLKVVEFAGVGPAPFGVMMLADLGATVLRIDRLEDAGLGVKRPPEFNYVLRNRDVVRLDLKNAEDLILVREIVAKADILVEGFRPGVMERLGLGPDRCLEDNPRLVYARMTGWGQDGPMATVAGHDLNYIGITGGLDLIGRAGQLPAPPLNVMGDFAGGGMTMVIGILAALQERAQSGRGQVVDANVVDGTLCLLSQFFGMRAAGIWSLERGTNVLDSGAPYYDVYPCSDDRLLALAAIEDKFFAIFLELAGLPAALMEMKRDKARWPELRQAISAKIRTRTRDEWTAIFEDTDACVSPVLTLDEAASHRHLRDREAFIVLDGAIQPAPTPRFSRSRPATPRPASQPVEHLKGDLLAWWTAQPAPATTTR